MATATSTSAQLLVIDADAHVIETERTWDYLEPAEQAFRPRLFASPDEPGQQYWVIENKIRGFRFPTLTEQQLQEMSQRAGRELTTPQAAREVDDVALRLSHLDALGIDIQVLDEAIEPIHTAKSNGAVAVWMRPIEEQRSMVDPDFYPLYEEASRLDLAIAVTSLTAARRIAISTATCPAPYARMALPSPRPS
jgi:predicted TIM-barrel fold metal-dependent hydrolase